MGVVEEVGSEVRNVKVGDFVVGSFVISDNTREICRSGYQSGCVHREFVAGTIGTQAEKARIPYADGTLVPTPGQPDEELIPSLLAASDVLGTGWFGAVAAEAGPGKTVAVVGDGAVGLMAVLAAKQLGAERIIAMSRHPERQKLARFYGATDIVAERGDEGVARTRELTGGLGAHSVIEAVGTQEATMQAVGATRPGGHMGFVGVNHDVSIPGIDLFFANIHVHGGPAPVRRFLPELIRLIWDRRIDPGKVFDLTLPLEQAAEGYKAMDEDAPPRCCSPSDPARSGEAAAPPTIVQRGSSPSPAGRRETRAETAVAGSRRASDRLGRCHHLACLGDRQLRQFELVTEFPVCPHPVCEKGTGPGLRPGFQPLSWCRVRKTGHGRGEEAKRRNSRGNLRHPTRTACVIGPAVFEEMP